MAMLILFKGYLKSKYDVRELAESITKVTATADRAKMGDIDRQLWYELSGGKKERNFYSTPLPFLQRGAHNSNTNVLPFEGVGLQDEVYKAMQIPEEIEKNIDKRNAVLLLSGTLYLYIKERLEDTALKKEELWVPPRDINEIYDGVTEEELGLNQICYAVLHLTDLKYVSEYKGSLQTVVKKPSLFEHILNQSSTARQMWDGFKDTFLDADPLK